MLLNPQLIKQGQSLKVLSYAIFNIMEITPQSHAIDFIELNIWFDPKFANKMIMKFMKVLFCNFLCCQTMIKSNTQKKCFVPSSKLWNEMLMTRKLKIVKLFKPENLKINLVCDKLEPGEHPGLAVLYDPILTAINTFKTFVFQLPPPPFWTMSEMSERRTHFFMSSLR